MPTFAIPRKGAALTQPGPTPSFPRGLKSLILPARFGLDTTPAPLPSSNKKTSRLSFDFLGFSPQGKKTDIKPTPAPIRAGPRKMVLPDKKAPFVVSRRVSAPVASSGTQGLSRKTQAVKAPPAQGPGAPLLLANGTTGKKRTVSHRTDVSHSGPAQAPTECQPLFLQAPLVPSQPLKIGASGVKKLHRSRIPVYASRRPSTLPSSSPRCSLCGCSCAHSSSLSDSPSTSTPVVVPSALSSGAGERVSMGAQTEEASTGSSLFEVVAFKTSDIKDKTSMGTQTEPEATSIPQPAVSIPTDTPARPCAAQRQAMAGIFSSLNGASPKLTKRIARENPTDLLEPSAGHRHAMMSVFAGIDSAALKLKQPAARQKTPGRADHAGMGDLLSELKTRLAGISDPSSPSLLEPNGPDQAPGGVGLKRRHPYVWNEKENVAPQQSELLELFARRQSGSGASSYIFPPSLPCDQANVPTRKPLRPVARVIGAGTPSASMPADGEHVKGTVDSPFGSRLVRRVVVPPLDAGAAPSHDTHVLLEMDELRAQGRVSGAGGPRRSSGGRELSLRAQGVLRNARKEVVV
ncbi:hypothetical protein C8J57DRAFT_1525329 [Mycena rebaudengoi]|nr:hypothetical protein C8J57DRAFT_1525329 [Mycena rebaudengoi]